MTIPQVTDKWEYRRTATAMNAEVIHE